MKDLKKLLPEIKNELVLSSEEHAHIRSALETLTRAEPVPTPFLRLFFYPSPAFALALVVFLVGSSAAWAAEGALPGDTLYSMKVSVNERVERGFAGTPERKAVVDVRHAEERLREVELLAARGDANEKVVETAALEVEKHVTRASETARLLAEEGNDTAADTVHSQIAFTLAAHADILDAQAELEAETPQRLLRSLSTTIAITADDVDDAREEEAEERGRLDRSVRDAIVLTREANLEKTITKLTNELNEKGITEEAHAELLTELGDITVEFAAAKALRAEDEYRDAGEAYEEVERRAYRALALLESARRIGRMTDKEVVIQIDSPGEKRQAKTTPMQAMTMSLSASTTEEAVFDTANESAPERKLRFWVQDKTYGE